MKQKKLVSIVAGIVLIAVVAAAAGLSSGGLFQGSLDNLGRQKAKLADGMTVKQLQEWGANQPGEEVGEPGPEVDPSTPSTEPGEEVVLREYPETTELPLCLLGQDQNDQKNEIFPFYKDSIDGEACMVATQANWSAGDTIIFDAGEEDLIGQYNRASFFLKVKPALTGSNPNLRFEDIRYGVENDRDTTRPWTYTKLSAKFCQPKDAMTNNNIASKPNTSAMLPDTWYACTVPTPDNTGADQYWSFEIDPTRGLGGTYIIFDQLTFHKQ